MHVKVQVQADKYADLLSITDPHALENRLKSLIQTKHEIYTADHTTPGIDIVNEEHKDVTVGFQDGFGGLTNV